MRYFSHKFAKEVRRVVGDNPDFTWVDEMTNIPQEYFTDMYNKGAIPDDEDIIIGFARFYKESPERWLNFTHLVIGVYRLLKYGVLSDQSIAELESIQDREVERILRG